MHTPPSPKRSDASRPARISLAAVLVWVVLLLAACASKSVTAGTAGGATAATAPHAAALVASRATAGFHEVAIRVPAGSAEAPFDVQRRLRIPAGWSAEVWARLPDARFAVWTPRRTLLVSSSATGRVVELTAGRSGALAHERVVASGLAGPQGLAFDRLDGAEFLYVAETDQIDRYVWRSDGTLGARTVVVGGLPDTDSSGDDVHRAKSIAIGRDHTIYVTAGSASNASPTSPGESPPRASILAVGPNGDHLRVFARGVRNGEGLSFAPDGSLWTAVNQRDEIAYPFHSAYGDQPGAYGRVIATYVDEHPPDELARLTPGRNLGWPYCDPDPDVTPGSPTTAYRYGAMPFVDDAQTNAEGSALNCAALAPIERGIPAHSAPLGFHFLQGTTIAAPWSSGAAVGSHGSWDRSPPRAPSVLWLPWQSRARTLGRAITLIGGFQEPSGNRWGRPVDAVAGPDGALYVTDDAAGAVYRVGPTRNH